MISILIFLLVVAFIMYVLYHAPNKIKDFLHIPSWQKPAWWDTVSKLWAKKG